ncbi:MAG: CotH kinase family protein, partial [Oscillospiraceae bacterium]|nr:CotH kinase family protein [Oscillospiraceae bacterium]
MNHKRLKRLGAALLAAVMLLSMLPVSLTVSAEESVPFGVSFADPYAKVGQPMNLTVTGASGAVTYSWAVDGNTVSTEATYTPTEDDLMKWIVVTVQCGSDSAYAQMFFSKLPVVYINTEGGAPIVSKEEYIDAELIVQGNETYNSETTTLYSGKTEIRGRGNSTWAQPKKPYRLKLDKKTDLFGMGKSKHWVLLANYLDESLQRNTLAYNLSGAMGMEQMSTVFVDVVLNGDFVGNYQLCENIRIDDTRVDIFDWEGFCEDSAAVIAEAESMDDDTAGDLESYMVENMEWITSGSFQFGGVTYQIADYPDIEVPDINGGYLIELDEYYDEISRFKTNSNQPIMFKSPEYLYTNDDMMDFVKAYIQAFEDAVHSDTYTANYDGSTLHYSELFDFDALVDYWLINEIFFNEELNKKSTYMYKDIDGLMMMGPIWDMDWSSGGEGQTYHTEQWATRYYSTNAQADQWYKYLIQDPYFFIKAQERYWEIRNDQVAAMLTELDSNEELLTSSANANGKRWGYKHDYSEYVDDLRTWFNEHLTWLDTQMATQDSLRDSLGYHPSSRLALSLTDSNGNALQKESANKAPADAIAAAGSNLKLVIVGGNDTNGVAALYVNGRRISETETQANATTTVDVPAASLTAPEGEKNVIEVQIEKPDGTINASRYITVVVTATGEHEHSYEAVVTAPTCTEGGYTTYTCSCGNSYIADETDPLGHTEVTAPDQAPTFDEPGMTGGTVCSVCGETLSAPQEIPQLDYNEGIIPIPVLTVTAGDEEPNGGAKEGPAEFVLDDNFDTIWHTNWKGTSRDNHWIQFELSEDYIVDGLRYKPREGAKNGTIVKYEIQVSDDGETFRTVASGDWEKTANWKVVEFEGEQVKFVRLVALDATGDNQYVFASAAEIRLTGVKSGELPHEHEWSDWTVTKAATCSEAGVETR